MTRKRIIQILKLALSLSLIGIIWHYFLKIEQPELVWQSVKQIPVWIYPLAVLSSMINWGLEAKKWQLLMAQLQKLKFLTAWKSTCAGASVSNIFPFRIGEYLGRILYIKSEHHLPAIFNSVFGSTMQLVVSMLFGIPAGFLILDNKLQTISTWAVFALLFIIIIFILVFVISAKIRNSPKKWLRKVLEDIRNFSPKQILQVFLLSIFRYIIFSGFYVFLLYKSGISGDILYLYQAVATIYLLQSFAPGMLLTDAGLRTGIPLIVFKSTPALQPAILAAAIFNYFFNILFPSILGLGYILSYKLRASK